MKRCQTFIVLYVELGAETEQKVDGTCLTVTSSQVHRSVTIRVLEVDVDAHFTEEIKDEIEARLSCLVNYCASRARRASSTICRGLHHLVIELCCKDAEEVMIVVLDCVHQAL